MNHGQIRWMVYGWQIGVCCALLMVSGRASAATNDTQKTDVELFQQQVKQWLALKSACASEASDWRTTEQRMQEEVRLLELRRDQLEQEKKRLDETLASRDTEQESLLKNVDATQRALQSLEALPNEWEHTLQALYRRIPAPLQEELQMDADVPGGTDWTVSQRLRRLLDLYGRIEQLQQQVHVVTEVMEVRPGESREVDVMYLGISAGYAVARDGTWAAVGRPGTEGWQWSAAEGKADIIRQAMRVCANEEPPELVRLPLQFNPEGD